MCKGLKLYYKFVLGPLKIRLGRGNLAYKFCSKSQNNHKELILEFGILPLLKRLLYPGSAHSHLIFVHNFLPLLLELL